MIPDWVEHNPADQGNSNLNVKEKKDDSQPPVEPAVNRLVTQLLPRFETPGDTPSPTSSPSGQRFSYIRVSSTDQNLARQREMIGAVDKEFFDEVSTKSGTGRPGLERCIDYLRDHDELYVASIGAAAENGIYRTLRTLGGAQAPEFACSQFGVVAPGVVTGEVDVFPTQW